MNSLLEEKICKILPRKRLLYALLLIDNQPGKLDAFTWPADKDVSKATMRSLWYVKKPLLQDVFFSREMKLSGISFGANTFFRNPQLAINSDNTPILQTPKKVKTVHD